VKDGASVDEEVTQTVVQAFHNCANSQTLVTVTQAESGVMNPVTGQPVGGSGNLVVMLGGTYYQHMIRYLEDSALTRAYNKYDTNARFFVRGLGGAADSMIVEDSANELSEPNASRGYFLIESVVDPASHTWALEIYGLGAQGTRAGAWFFSNQVIKNLSTFPKQYYIYKWVDAGSDGGPPLPSTDDTFTELGSGS
jgi:hypothetical protein